MGGKKVNQASTKICKATHDHNNNFNKKQFNNMINVLKPKVYITDASNFKKLVQELTGNYHPVVSPTPIFHPHQKPVIMPNIIDIDLIQEYHDQDQDHQDMYRSSSRERSFDSLVETSEASFPTSVTTSDQESSPETTTTFDVLESFNYGATSFNYNNIGFPDCGDIESWLLEIDNYCIPAATATGFQQADHLSLYDFDFSDLI